MSALPVVASAATFTATGGVTLFRRVWEPDGELRAVVVLAHGLGEHSGRYDDVARRLASNGFAVWALDHRGHGRSAGRRVHVERFAAYEDDLELLRRQAMVAHPDLPRVLLGHSMGGAIALGHVIDHPGAFDALVLSGPLTDAAHGLPAAVVVAGRWLARIAPTLPLIRFDGAAVSRDPAVVQAYLDDPLVYRGRLTAGLGNQLVARTARFPDEVGGLRLPVLVVHGTADRLVPIDTSRELVAQFGSADVTLAEQPGLYHEVLNEPEREAVLTVIIDWIEQRLPAMGVRP